MDTGRRFLADLPALPMWFALFVLVVVVSGCTSDQSDRGGHPHFARVGDCYLADASRRVDCDQPHTAQTVYVSRHRLDQTSQALAPCRTGLARFLGEDLNTRLDVKLWVPTDASWYRCDVLLRNSTGDGSGYQDVSSSLEGVFTEGATSYLHACLDAPYDPLLDQEYVPCSDPHAAQELVVAPAIGTLREPFPADVADRAASACNATAAAEGHLVGGRGVSAYYPKNADAWSTGERTADCWVTARRGKLPAVRP